MGEKGNEQNREPKGVEKRTGGDVETREGTHTPPPDRGRLRTGGDVETRGAGGKKEETPVSPRPKDKSRRR